MLRPLFSGEAVEDEAPILQLLVPTRAIFDAMLPLVVMVWLKPAWLKARRLKRVQNFFILYAFNGDVGSIGQDLNSKRSGFKCYLMSDPNILPEFNIS